MKHKKHCEQRDYKYHINIISVFAVLLYCIILNQIIFSNSLTLRATSSSVTS